MTMDAFLVIGDLYNGLFATQTSDPDIMVDYRVWNKIKATLPSDYKLPDPTILERLAQLKN